MDASLLNKFISNQGYKKDSPDVDRPVNVIPSNEITMEGVEFPVQGVDNLGNKKIMQPEENYKFPGDYVIETPVYNDDDINKMASSLQEKPEPKTKHQELNLDEVYKENGAVFKTVSDIESVKNLIALMYK